MLFPYSTDAPVYYWPYGTIGLIIANVVMSIVGFGASQDLFDWLVLTYGGIYPTQWVTSIFVHAGIGHLVGNMFFLWTFGLIVEGKVGWKMFVPIYLAIGIAECMIEQGVFIMYEGASLGASSAIFGIMAIALIWAPKNEVSIFMLLFFYPIFFTLPVFGMAAFYIVLNVLFIFLVGLEPCSEVLHTLGVMVGAPIGIVLVTRRYVDCEGFDIFSIVQNKEGRKIKTVQQEKEEQIAHENYLAEKREALEAGQRQVNAYLQQGHIDMALARFKVMKNYDARLQLTEHQLYQVIRLLNEQRRWKESVPLMEQYIESEGQQKPIMQLKLAQICLDQLERPRKVLATLKQMEFEHLQPNHQKVAKQLVAKAKKMIAEGHLDVQN